ncbi:50S ribosomal protein L14 [candidate division WWE3 bacterium RBG_19FT_COMBO_34_6]|uniref:Large ribosomal subunit protein uL14 n=1 Tax=candidate division WWE3 bacterium RBG_19FT_COMBO_34_6 TaxID=1802612 RepID=A0A1F4UJQ6_UNCKA|nr:MAG: 50S ribosomal protein L14 [candidate division WWE3 bacterium RBG_19FT_COMBO_34_6]
MVHVGTILNVADNSGAKRLKLIGIPGSSNRKRATVGDVVTLVVDGALGVGTLKDHTVVKGIVVRTSKEVRRKDGSYIRFDDNAAVVINDEKLMVGTRVFGPVAREIRDRGYLKIASLAKEVW